LVLRFKGYKMNIPIYRAKKINSDEYVEGYYYVEQYDYDIHHIGTKMIDVEHEGYQFNELYAIDQSTLAIHFPDMIDSKGNKIFASLSKDGKGGDIIHSIYRDNIIAIWVGYPCFRMEYKKIDSKFDREFNELSSEEIKVIRIQQ